MVVSGVAAVLVALAGIGVAFDATRGGAQDKSFSMQAGSEVAADATRGGAPDQSLSTQAGPPTGQAPGRTWNARLKKQNNSGQPGTVSLTDTPDGRTRIEVELTGAGPGKQPAHIHVGPCGSLDPRPRYPLNPVEAGRSETVVPVELQTLVEGKFSIRVQGTAAETAVSCGEIVGG